MPRFVPRRRATIALVLVSVILAAPVLAAPSDAGAPILEQVRARWAAWIEQAVELAVGGPSDREAPVRRVGRKDGGADDPADPPADEPPNRHWAQIEPGG